MNTRPRKKTAYFGIKIEPKLKRQVEQSAKAEGTLVSMWLREAIVMKLSFGRTETVSTAQ